LVLIKILVGKNFQEVENQSPDFFDCLIINKLLK
jgi:hypothetical protein